MPVKVFGLPTHILIIHLTVVGVPAACFAVIAIAARTKWRQKYGLATAALAVVMTVVTYLTQLAGEQLFNHAAYLDTAAAEHKKLGETLVYFVGAVALFAVIMVLVDRIRDYSEHHVIMVTLSALAIAASAICLVRVVQVGDSGARAAWGNDPITSSAAPYSTIG